MRDILAHANGVAHSDLLRWDPDVDATEYSVFMAAVDDVLSGGDGLRVEAVRPLIKRILYVDDRLLPIPAVHWMKLLLSSKGFGGYPTYGLWLSQLSRALRKGESPKPPKTILDDSLLELCRRATRLYLRAAPYLGRETTVSVACDSVPSWRPEDLKNVRWTRSRALLHDYTNLVESLYWALRAHKIDIVPTVTFDMSSSAGNLPFDRAIRHTILEAYYLIVDLNRYLDSQLGKKRQAEQDGQATAEAGDSENPDAVEVQIGELRKQLAKYLDSAAKGGRFVVKARGSVRALLGPLTPAETPAKVRTLTRGVFQQTAGSHLADLRQGTALAVEGALFRAPDKATVKAHEEAATERRKKAKRDGMERLRTQRRVEQERQRALDDAKLREAVGMSPDDVRDARQLLEKTRKKSRRWS